MTDEFPAIRALGEISIHTRLLMVADALLLLAERLERSQPQRADAVRQEAGNLEEIASELEGRCLGPKGHG